MSYWIDPDKEKQAHRESIARGLLRRRRELHLRLWLANLLFRLASRVLNGAVR